MLIEDKQLVVSTCFLSAHFILVAPLTILVGNYEEYSYTFVEFLLFSIPYFLLTFTLLTIPVILLNRFAKRLYLLITVLVLALAVIYSQMLFGNYGVFDGRGLDIDESSTIAALQLLVLIVVAAGVLFPKARKNILYFSSIFLIVNFAFCVILFLFDGGSFTKEPSGPSQNFVNLSNDNPNYLYIVLDEVYGGSTQKLFAERADLAAKFTGFTNYTNAAGNYPTTIMSIPAILTNQLYEDGYDKDEFTRQSFLSSPLLRVLKSNGFDSRFHTVGRYCPEFPDDTCSHISTLGAGVVVVQSEYYELLDLALFKSVPDVIKDQVYNQGNWLIRNLDRGDESSHSARFIREFNYLVGNLNALNGPPTFRLFHTTLTHSPVRHNGRCELLKINLKSTFENHLAQDTCGFVEVSRIIDKLHDLDVYDNTYIVISSDHGRARISPELSHRFARSANGVTSSEYGYAHVTLMIKPLSAKGKLRNSHEPISLLDIAPAIASSIEGRDHDIASRRRYYHYIWGNNWDDKTLPPFESVYSIGADITEPSNWGLDSLYMQKVLKNRRFLTLGCGRKLSFSASNRISSGHSGKQDVYFSRGLSRIGSDGRWSDRGEVSIFVKLPEDHCPMGKLTMNVRGFVKPQRPVQKSKVLLNGTQIGQIVVNLGDKNPQDFEFDIAPALVNVGEVNLLEFRIDNPVSPESLGLGIEQRLLGLGFVSLVFQ